MKILITAVMTIAIFIMGYGFGAISEPPPPPEECKVVKIDYDPEYDEPESVWYKGVVHDR